MVTEEEIKKLVIARLSSMPENMKISIGAYGSFDKYMLIDRELEDARAETFFNSSNQVVLTLLSGKTSGEAYEKSQLSFRKWIEHFSSSASPPGSEHIVSWLIWDMFCQRIEGKKDSCL